jgi:hypothetical protein
VDEARLALNIAARSFRGLGLPLDYDQTAPLLYLWATKLVTVLGGSNEYAMRAIPFVAGLAMLPLTYALARRLVNERAALLATGIAAVSPLYLQYVRQVKPYTLDGLAALVLLWLALDLMDRPTRQRPWRRLVIVGAVAIWTSIIAVFILAGLLVVLWFAHGIERPRRDRLAVAGAVWAVSFLPAYMVVYHPASQNPYLQEFWRGSMLTLWDPGVIGRGWQATREFIWQIFGGGSTEPPLAPVDRLLVDSVVVVMASLAAVGVRFTAQRASPARAALLLAPLAAAVAASLIGKYPIAGRIMLFAAPGFVIGVAAGATRLVESAAAGRRRVAVMTLAWFGLVGLSLPLGVTLALHPLAFEHLRPAVAELARRSHWREPIYVNAAALPAWTFYTTNWTSPDRPRLARMARLGSLGGPAFENGPPRKRAVRPNEGQGLAFPIRDAAEIIGLYVGAQWRSGVGAVQDAADSGWVTAEAARVRAAADSAGAVWVLFIRPLGLHRHLYAAMRMCVTDAFTDRGAFLARFVPRRAERRDCVESPVP